MYKTKLHCKDIEKRKSLGMSYITSNLFLKNYMSILLLDPQAENKSFL